MGYKGWFHRLGVGFAANGVKSWKWELYWPHGIFSLFIALSIYGIITSGGLANLIFLIGGSIGVFWVEKSMGKLRHMSMYGRVKFFAKYYGVSPYEVFTELMEKAGKRVNAP